MAHVRPRATDFAPSDAHREHVRGTIQATVLFLLALGLAATVAAPINIEAAAAAWTDGFPIYVAGG